ncbi:MAG: recombinase family protein, partial [Dehalococcoidia bacterium]
RKMYRLLVEEKVSTWAIAKLLTEQGVVTAMGAARWQPTAVHRMLTNPAYKGTFEYRHSPSEVVSIPVPPIIDEARWDAAKNQLKENSLYSSRNNKHNSYLLRGLIRCPRCGGAYTGYLQRGYRGYRCNRAHWASSSTGKRCSPGSIRAKPVEDVVWAAVKEALQCPDLLNEEYERRLAESGTTESVEYEQKQLALAQKRLEAQGDRVTDAYINEAMDLSRYKIEMEKLRGRRENLDKVAQELDDKANRELSRRDALEHLRRFCDQVSQGLDVMTFEERQQLLRLVVERITVEEERVTVETVIPTGQDDVKLRNRRGELVEP